MSEEKLGSKIKTASQPWWLVFPLLLVVASMAPFFLSQKNQTEQTLEKLNETIAVNEYVPTKNQEEPEINKRMEKLLIANTILQNTLDGWVEDNYGEYSVVIKELNGLKRSAQLNSKDPFISASTYKLFVVYAVLSEIENSKLTILSKTSLGYTVEECIDSLLTYSWDICAYPMGKLVGWDNLTKLLHSSGFKDTNIDNYDENGEFIADKYTTADDEALFMSKLYKGELLNKKHTALIIDALKNQKWRERIPAGVPKSIEVADKPGWLYDLQNDAAIVYGTYSDYVLIIFSDSSSVEKLADLSETIYKVMDVELL